MAGGILLKSFVCWKAWSVRETLWDVRPASQSKGVCYPRHFEFRGKQGLYFLCFCTAAKTLTCCLYLLCNLFGAFQGEFEFNLWHILGMQSLIPLSWADRMNSLQLRDHQYNEQPIMRVASQSILLQHIWKNIWWLFKKILIELIYSWISTKTSEIYLIHSIFRAKTCRVIAAEQASHDTQLTSHPKTLWSCGQESLWCCQQCWRDVAKDLRGKDVWCPRGCLSHSHFTSLVSIDIFLCAFKELLIVKGYGNSKF